MAKNNLSMLLSDFYEKINPNNNYTRFAKVLDAIKSQSNTNVESIQDPRIIFQNFYNKIKTFSNGPLGYSVILSFCVLFYFYFANNFIYYLIGLFIPGYWTYLLLSDENFIIIDIKDMAIYFVIFSHLEFFSFIFESAISLIYLKIAIIIFFNNILVYNKDLLKTIYEKIIVFDKVVITFMGFVLVKLYNEFIKIMDNVNILTLADSKKQM
ncbi:hypothetical protein H012_gp292 [Acanthamoeba polyphaga moumouvirus]|uniref:Uncharacterized protein n=2 Tax=Moumouvirus TaxID=3080801 RepID=L7RCW4_9VIRU|nr:hypothetical protein H012_gp292 [Acanthamoeba polyphaga moumouvirus]AEX62513.1 hypothetical protein mv_R308 [Moumouvirus Monve]AGC02162.1 hypothetical protein Moumou_00638 [Acanthamoeba polyphaga moumouvirus]